MGRKERLQLIKEISHKRNSTVICYVTGDRKNINTRVAPDAIQIIYRHLKKSNPGENIDLFIYTRGGDVLTPWRLVNLIREYCSQFRTLVPFRAYSAGTMICLGANEIVMGKMGELGPIDPTVANAFNPQNPNNPTAKIPISVEDVSSYLDLARHKFNLEEKELAEVFARLTAEVHPLALGNVHRNYLLIRSTAEKLLSLHLDNNDKINKIINYLTEKLYAHNYMIPRQEVKQLNLPVNFPKQDLEKPLWQLYKVYEQDLKLATPFRPLEHINQENNKFKVPGGFIESEVALDSYIYTGRVKQDEMMEEPEVNIIEQSWQSKIMN